MISCQVGGDKPSELGATVCACPKFINHIPFGFVAFMYCTYMSYQCSCFVAVDTFCEGMNRYSEVATLDVQQGDRHKAFFKEKQIYMLGN